MPDPVWRVAVDGDDLDADGIASVVDVQVEESTDRASAAVLTVQLTAAPDGSWTSPLDALVTARTPVTVELGYGATSYRFEGKSVAAQWSIAPGGNSVLRVDALDRSVDLDIEEKVVAWPGTSDSEIATTIFTANDLLANVADTPDGPDPDVHVVLQRGTDWAFLRELARKRGYALFVDQDGPAPVGHFHPIDPLAEPQGELILGYGSTEPATVRADLLAGRRVRAARLAPLDATLQQGDDDGTEQAQGRTSLGAATTVLLGPQEADGEIEAQETAAALARASAFGIRLTVRVDTTIAGMLLRAGRTVLVTGLGSRLSGRYLVDRVRHRVGQSIHEQDLVLVRNAFDPLGDEASLLGSTL